MATLMTLLLAVASHGIASPAVAVVGTDCTYTVSAAELRHGQSGGVWRTLSRNAEIVTAGTSAPVTLSPRRRAVAPPAPPTAVNFIDTEIFGAMERAGIAWTSRSSDEEYLRRAFLDLTGQIPTAAQVRSFMADTSLDKRERVINDLLHSEGYVDRFTLWFGDLVANVRESANIRQFHLGRNAFHRWIRDAFASNMPYDRMVRETITAEGGSFTTGPATNYWVRRIDSNGPIQDTYDNLAAASAEQFLGVPLNCLSCHDGRGHLERVNFGLASRTRYEFWQQAAFFAQTGFTTRRNASDAAEYIVADNTTGEYRLDTQRGNKSPRVAPPNRPAVVTPAFFLTGERPRNTESRREAYARMLTSDPQFARATVNYIWKEMFGAGIVEPVNSFDLLLQDASSVPAGGTLQPTHPELLTKLAAYFTASGYDIRALLTLILRSNTYQLSSVYTPGAWDPAWAPYHARHYPRRLMAESVLDAIARATGIPPELKVAGFAAPFSRAMALPDPLEPVLRSDDARLLEAFGRGDRDTTPRSDTASVLQAVQMLASPAISRRVDAGNRNSAVAQLLSRTTDPDLIVSEIFMMTLSRQPSATEQLVAASFLRSRGLVLGSETLQFALLNRVEFLFK